MESPEGQGYSHSSSRIRGLHWPQGPHRAVSLETQPQVSSGHRMSPHPCPSPEHPSARFRERPRDGSPHPKPSRLLRCGHTPLGDQGQSWSLSGRRSCASGPPPPPYACCLPSPVSEQRPKGPPRSWWGARGLGPGRANKAASRHLDSPHVDQRPGKCGRGDRVEPWGEGQGTRGTEGGGVRHGRGGGHSAGSAPGTRQRQAA